MKNNIGLIPFQTGLINGLGQFGAPRRWYTPICEGCGAVITPFDMFIVMV